MYGKYQQTIFLSTCHPLSKLQQKMEKFGHNLERSPPIQLMTKNGELQLKLHRSSLPCPANDQKLKPSFAS
jgi:hypothetical protein